MHRRRLSAAAPFRRALIGMTLGAVLCAPAAPARADGLPTETRYYQIPAGSLEAAVNRLGREAGVMISFGSHVAAGRQTAGLDGRYSLLDALKQLLVGSGIEVAGDARDGFVLRPDGRSADGNPDSLPAVVVIADHLRDEIRLPVVVISD
ncbi:MAG: STN domain-containing protein, partial [Microvirgula sp.]